MPRYPVVMEVKEIKAEFPPACPVHKVGDKIVIDNGCVEGRICLPVLVQQVSRLYGLVNGMPTADKFTYACPDKGKVVYEIRRDSSKWWKDAMQPKSDAEFKPSSAIK